MMEKKKWIVPEIECIEEVEEYKILSLESSLYASGCHHGMGGGGTGGP